MVGVIWSDSLEDSALNLSIHAERPCTDTDPSSVAPKPYVCLIKPPTCLARERTPSDVARLCRAPWDRGRGDYGRNPQPAALGEHQIVLEVFFLTAARSTPGGSLLNLSPGQNVPKE